ncbi:MAG: hypothetical protein A2139_07300 [Desulfobacca sp. RBG_16_60_12]|nr:MAG: hypothetical protein A2139_07300 [Desulfobacca sp. RBG_16_60_12]
MILVLGAIGAAFQAYAEETSHLAVVTEYVRELAANENTRANAERELNASNSSSGKLSSAIHTSKLFQLELRSQINMLKSMHLDPPFDDIIPNIIASYEQKIALYQKIIDLNSILLAGPQPGVDYGELAAEMPKIRAQMDYVDKTLFIATPLLFATLIDQKPDSKNHLSHLIITKKEREKLLHNLTAAFGKKLEQKNQNYGVSSASVLKAYLSKDYKCSDEPWQ